VKSNIDQVKDQRRNSSDRTGRAKKVARHVRIYHWMMDTAAWKSLSGNQRAIYVEMAARYNGWNNGRIPYSIREAAESLHIGKSTAARDLAVLRERGFIIPRKKGAFTRPSGG
jgi:Fic family protein